MNNNKFNSQIKLKFMKRVFLIISIIFASQIAKSQSVTPDSYDWADNTEAYIGKTIVLLARTEGTDKYVINQQERYEASYNKNYTEYRGERLFCYKKFKELKTGVKIVVNIPQKFWDNKGALIPKEYNGSYYKLTLKVTGEEPQNVCDGNRVSGSGSNRVFYILEKIVRYNN